MVLFHPTGPHGTIVPKRIFHDFGQQYQFFVPRTTTSRYYDVAGAEFKDPAA